MLRQLARHKAADNLVIGIADCKRAFMSACKQAGITDLRFHDLRHTFATRLIAARVAVEEVARILGHAQVSMTYRYVNATPEMLRSAFPIMVSRCIELAIT